MITIEPSFKALKLVVEKTGLFQYRIGPTIRMKVEEGEDYIRVKSIDHGLFEAQDIWASEKYNTREFLEKNQDYLAALAMKTGFSLIKVGQTTFSVNIGP